jgi:hypothetical protein
VILYFGKNIESFLTHFNNLGICTPVKIKEPSENGVATIVEN